MLRIISGRAKGCRLLSPAGGAGTRPTSDRIKESLFNILPLPEGMDVLDLFAGTGNIGLEAMSRGADRLWFVEKDAAMNKVIRRNLDKCDFKSGYEILPLPIERAIETLFRKEQKFDLIFADPPYDRGWIERTICLLSTGALLKRNAIIAIQHSHREKIPENTGILYIADQRKYGDTLITILKPDRGKVPNDCPAT